MSTASERNHQALECMVGNSALAGRLSQTRLAVITPPGVPTRALQLLSEFVVDTLCRLWDRVDFHGGLADEQAVAGREVGNAGGADMHVRWLPGYTVVIALGCRAPVGCADHIIEVSYDDWRVELGTGAAMGETPNAVAAAFLAAMAAAQTFFRVFADAVGDFGTAPLEIYAADLRDLYGLNPAPTALALPPTVIFGVGAVGHAFLAILERWPHPVKGSVEMVDPDLYGGSNMQRYAFMKWAFDTQAKVEVRRKALIQRHPELQVTACRMALNEYCQHRGYTASIDLAIVGLDSAEARRQVALKLPERTVNLWTEGKRAGGALYTALGNQACLGCDYLEPKSELMDETARIAQQTGLLPGIVRRLLDNADPLTDTQAQTIAARQSVPAATLVGEPLRSVLPTLCATGRLVLPGSTSPAEVPFAFSSLFAGVAGFMLMLKALSANVISEGWSQHLFKAPTPFMRQPRGRQTACACCADLHLLRPRVDNAA